MQLLMVFATFNELFNFTGLYNFWWTMQLLMDYATFDGVRNF